MKIVLTGGLHNMKDSLVVKKNIIYIVLALLIALVFMNITIPESMTHVGDATLTKAGQTAMAVLLFALVLWMTEALPFHITGLLGIAMMALFKVDTFKIIVKSGFGNDIIIFFIGVLILSAYITRSGLGKRISMFILSKTGNHTYFIILGFLMVGVILSMWITNMAVAAMLMPLGRSILEEEKVTPLKSNFGKALMIACAWGSIVGGIGTPAGAGPNPLAVGFLRDMAGIRVSFMDWMIFGIPSAFLLLLPTWGIILLFFKPEMKRLSKSKEQLKDEYGALPKMDREEKITVTIFVLTAVLWVTSSLFEKWLGMSIPISMPVLITSALFFFPGVSKIKWKDIEPDISWSGIILVVSGISLGMMLYNSGAAQWLSVVLLGNIGSVHPFVQILAIVFIISMLKIVFSSNTVTATIIIPIMIALAESLGINPLAMTLPAALTSSLAFILVTSTPTNVIPYSAGYFSIKDMAKAGVVLTIISTIIIATSIYVIGRFVHIY